MRSRVLLALVVAVLALASPAGADLHHQKHSIEARLGGVQEKIAGAQARERALEADINSTTGRIRALEAKVGDVSTRLAALQEDLGLRQRRLDMVEKLYRTQTNQLAFLKGQQHLAEARLARRLVQVYESGDTSTLEIVLGARSLQDAIDRVSYFQEIAAQDHQIAGEVASARTSLAAARIRTKRLRDRVRSETRIVAYRVAQQSAIRDELVGARNSLSDQRSSRQHDLAATKESEQEWQQEAASLRAESASLEARIKAAQSVPPSPTPAAGGATPSSSPSPSGLIWPVSGPITSPFGMRWGSLHPGIDIGAGFGTPIHAAVAGTVLVAGYNGGYGNLVVLDNGNSLSTAYAHQQSIAVTVGQTVTQGQIIGYVGSTGFSTGPHLHFEVRINGSPVDPLGYL